MSGGFDVLRRLCRDSGNRLPREGIWTGTGVRHRLLRDVGLSGHLSSDAAAMGRGHYRAGLRASCGRRGAAESPASALVYTSLARRGIVIAASVELSAFSGSTAKLIPGIPKSLCRETISSRDIADPSEP